MEAFLPRLVMTATEVLFRMQEFERSLEMQEIRKDIDIMVNQMILRVINTPIQFRFPLSKKKRIRKKWRRDPRNFRPLFPSGLEDIQIALKGGTTGMKELLDDKEYAWIRLHVPPKKVRSYDRVHACDNDGYAIPNFRNFYPPQIKYLLEKSHERYKKTEDGKSFESIRLTGEVGRMERVRFIETGGRRC